MILPTIHLNGSGRESLMKQYREAYMKLHDAVLTLRAVDVHSRDYYPQGPEKGAQAQAEHLDRQAKLWEVLQDLETIYNSIHNSVAP